ncbi:hypothetical protein Slin14017_G125070 [Septoria linicola]|nr:hypothetical protein Slin14017_G125070 [Septoria linicola]
MSPLETFVEDVRAALPVLVQDACTVPMTPPETPPRCTDVSKTDLIESIGSINTSQNQPFASEEDTPSKQAPDEEATASIASSPCCSTSPSPTNLANSQLLKTQLHSLKLQNSALKESFDLTNICYDLLLSDYDSLQQKHILLNKSSRQDHLDIRRLCKRNLRLRQDAQSFELANKALRQRVRESEDLVASRARDREELERLRSELLSVKESEEVRPERADLEEENRKRGEKKEGREQGGRLQGSDKGHSLIAQSVAVPVSTSILIDLLAIGLVQGAVYLWQQC